MASMTIRVAKLEDKEQVNRAHVRSIKEVCSKDYSPLQIQAWSDLKYSDDIWSNTVLNEFCYLVEKDSEVQGFCHAKVHDDGVGVIAGMYLTPDVIGQGFGRKLIEKCLDHLKRHGSKRIVLTGTKSAHGFYEAMGFEVKKEGVIQIRNTDIECLYMEYVRK